jgi:DNA recombination protein RmuC
MNLAVLLSLAVLAAVGCLAWALIERGRSGRLALELRLVREQAEAGHEALRGQAAQTAQAVADTLVQRATETFMAQDRLAQEKLEAQLKPVAETLEQFRKHVGEVETARARDQGGLKEQIEQLMAASSATQREAIRLSTALKRGAGVQGRWGEQMLRNVLEMAGLRLGIDFDEQVHTQGDEGALRPDVVVRLAGGGVFVIDSKVSLNDYMASVEATDPTLREAALKAHEDAMRRHIQHLSSKAYWAQCEKLGRSLDIVAMFVPSESAYACLAERAPNLVADAWAKKVAIVTPSALFPLLRAVAYGWRAEDQAANARHIAALGAELYRRLSNMGIHVHNLGRGLQQAVARYNDFVGSLESQVLTQARKFEDLKADAEHKTIVELSPVETAVRPLAKLSVETSERPTLTVGNRAPTSAA